MKDYEELISEIVFGEKQAATYKLVSRRLRIHVNKAKECLWNFYKKNENSVNATYAIVGVKRIQNIQGESNTSEDPPTSSVDTVKNEGGKESGNTLQHHSITLTGTDNFEAEKKEYEKISSIHIYSLAESDPKDPTLLEAASTEARKATNEGSIDDQFAKNGVIRNTRITEEELQSYTSKVKGVTMPIDNSNIKETAPTVPQNESKQRSKRNNVADMFKNAPAKSNKGIPATAASKDVEMKDAPASAKAENSRERKQKELENMFDDDDEEEDGGKEGEEYPDDMEINLEMDDKKDDKDTEMKDASSVEKDNQQQMPEDKLQPKPAEESKKTNSSASSTPNASKKESGGAGKKGTGKQRTLQSFFKKG